MQAFFQVKLKLATIVIQDDSPLFPGMGFTKQPFSALISRHYSTYQCPKGDMHSHEPNSGNLFCNLIQCLDWKPTQEPHLVLVLLRQTFDNLNSRLRNILTLTF